MNWNIDEAVKKIKDKFKIIGRTHELKAILLAKKSDRPVLIEGPVGVGKTTLAKAIAKFLKQDFIRVDGDERFDEYKLVGYFEPQLVLKYGWSWKSFVPGPLVQAMMNGSILFINEINRLSEGAQNVLIPALDEKIIEIPKLGIIKAKNDFWVIATLNPTEYIGVTPLGEALKDRFIWIKLEYQTFDEEIEIVKIHSNVDNEIAKFAVIVVRATRRHPDIKRGSSVRGAIDLAKLIKTSINDGNDDKIDIEKLIYLATIALGTKIELVEGTNKTIEEVIREIIENVSSQFSFFREKKARKKNIIRAENKFDIIPEVVPSIENSSESLGVSNSYSDDLEKLDDKHKKDSLNTSETSGTSANTGTFLLLYPRSDEVLTLFRGLLGYYGIRLISEIREGKDIRGTLSQLWAPLDFDSIYILGQEAVKYRNFIALTALAEINPFAIAKVIEEYLSNIMHYDNIHLVHLFYLTKGYLSEVKREIFRRTAHKIIVKKALNILGSQSRKYGFLKRKTYYRPSLDFDLESTLELAIDKILANCVNKRDIICLERYEKRTAGVIILDISGSMYGEKNVLASIISAMSIYAMSPKDEISIILFADEPVVIKDIRERKSISKIINEIFEIKPIGFTNISLALKKALRELRKASLKAKKWTILITDGEYNRGDNPLKWARKFERLHVIQLGGSGRGSEICRLLARNRGKYVKVRNMEELFLAVRKVLRYLDR